MVQPPPPPARTFAPGLERAVYRPRKGGRSLGGFDGCTTKKSEGKEYYDIYIYMCVCVLCNDMYNYIYIYTRIFFRVP